MNAIRVPQVGEIGQYGHRQADGKVVPIAALVTAVIPSENPEEYPTIEMHTVWPDPPPHDPVPIVPIRPLIAATLTVGCWSPLPLNPAIAGSLAEIAPMESVTSLLRAEAPATHIHLHLDGLAAA